MSELRSFDCFFFNFFSMFNDNHSILLGLWGDRWMLETYDDDDDLLIQKGTCGMCF